MPSIITHHLFAEEVYTSLPNPIKNSFKINYNIYQIFAQSFDNLFYYSFFFPFKGISIRNLGLQAQRENVNLYFKNILLYQKEHPSSEGLAYLYGSICHYILDSNCHPFIIYYSGDVNYSLKYRGLHEKMETNIDAILLLRKKNIVIQNASLEDQLLPHIDFTPHLIAELNQVFLKTFAIPNIGKIYNKSTKTGYFILKHFVKDKTGIKKIIYHIKDHITFSSKRRYEYLSFHITDLNHDYLNENHELWLYPANQSITSTSSFMDLYNKSLDLAIYLIKVINDYFHNKISLEETLNIIGNNSYVTGEDCSLIKKLQYFKF